MKQTIRPLNRYSRTGSLILGLTLFSSSVLAQVQPKDSLQADSFSRRLSQNTENLIHLKTENLNKGLITSPDQLLTGQVAGLFIVRGNGQPGASANIRLHATQSAFGNTQPLIILNGMPLEITRASNYTDVLNSIHPNDIASITFSKDAAGIAVYGGKAANGIVYIKTKNSQKTSKTSFNFTSTAALSELPKKAGVLSADEFRKVVTENIPDKAYLLGSETTDWQDVIFRKAFSHDQHLSLSGSLLKTLPYRVSVGHLNQQGILKTSENKRNALAVSINPSMLQDHLQLNVNVHAAQQVLQLADTRAILAALEFDPTKPVYQANEYGGYYSYLGDNGKPYPYATTNPLRLLEKRHDQDNTRTIQGQAHLQYKVHFLPALKLNMRYGLLDFSNDFKNRVSGDMSATPYANSPLSTSVATRKTDLKELYFSYDHPATYFNSKFSLLAGASQNSNKFHNELKKHTYENTLVHHSGSNAENEKLTIFGKLAVTHKGRYNFETAYADERYSAFPSSYDGIKSFSVGVNWDIMMESFMADNQFFSSLKLSANYLSISNFHNNILLEQTLIDHNLRSEKIIKHQFGTTFGLMENRLTGNISFTTSKTKDILGGLPISRQTGYSYYFTNLGVIQSKGLEATFNYGLIRNENINWNIGTNISYSTNQIEELKGVDQLHYNNNLVLKKGLPVNTFILFDHLYDSNGRPIENSYKMVNGQRERIADKSSDPTLLFGIHTDVVYKRFNLNTLLRGSTGNYVYPLAASQRNYLNYMNSGSYLDNIDRSYLKDRFTQPQQRSHYFLEDASFVRMEYIQLGYDFGSLLNGKANLRINGTIQNAFVLTKYSGQDPEVNDGFDYGQYPMPRTYSIGLNLNI